jgi:hypothetical protein
VSEGDEMSGEQIDYRHELYKRFELNEHEIREGGKSKSGKIQWFIYVSREPIQARLDELFFMVWNLEYFDRHIGGDYVGVTCAISINGVTRQYSGGQGLNGKKSVDEDTIKGAYTDAFKRAASMWGMGLYLQNAPQIWTDGYEDKNWSQKDQRETEAWAKFAAWYNGVKYEQPKAASQPAENATTSPATPSNVGNGKVTALPPNTAVKTQEQLEAETASLAEDMPVDYTKNPSPTNKSDRTQWDAWVKRQYTIYKKVRSS